MIQDRRLLGFGVCVLVTCAHICMEYMFVWKPEASFAWLFSSITFTLIFETGFLTKSGTHQFMQVDYPANTRESPVSVFSVLSKTDKDSGQPWAPDSCEKGQLEQVEHGAEYDSFLSVCQMHSPLSVRGTHAHAVLRLCLSVFSSRLTFTIQNGSHAQVRLVFAIVFTSFLLGVCFHTTGS